MSSFDTFIDRRNTGACKWEAFSDISADGDLIPMTVADMEMPVAEPIKAALVKAAQHGICGYTEPDEKYVSALSSFLSRRHGMTVTKEQLCCTMGIVPAFGILIRALTEKGDGIILQPPVYTPFFDAITMNERKVIENPLLFDGEKYVINYNQLEAQCRAGAKILMLCSPHNPVGRVWTQDDLSQVGEICKKHNVLIICDEIHNDIILRGNRHVSLAALPEMRDITITCTAMSKTFNLAGLMLSNIIIYNRDIRDNVQKIIARDGSLCIPYFGRAAAIAAFTECDGWIDELCTHISDNFDTCYKFFEENVPAVKYVHAEGTYLMWINYSKLGLSEKEITDKFRAAKIPVNGGATFGTGGEGFLRLNIALPKEELSIALERMKEKVFNV